MLAARYLNDSGKWYDIALFNNLSYPYIALTGGPGVLRPGDRLAIPTKTANAPTKSATRFQSSTPEAIYGTDFELEETDFSQPGRPEVELKIDRRTHRDIAAVGGIPNLTQALQVRVWTQKNTYPLYPGYGMPLVVGVNATAENVTRVKLGLRGTILRDSRVALITRMSTELSDDILDFEIDVIPVGATVETTIKTALV